MNYTWKQLFNFFKEILKSIIFKIKLGNILKTIVFYVISLILIGAPTILGTILMLVFNNNYTVIAFMILLIFNVFWAVWIGEIMESVIKNKTK